MAKPIITKNKGETISQRPNRVRCRYELENGQLLSVYFTRERVDKLVYGLCYVWSVTVHIGRNRKEANRWHNSRKSKPILQTGDCGLEGLAVAARYIRQFGAHICGLRSEMQIGWLDDKRMRAYRYLLRYPGFAWYGEKGKGKCIAYRNPDIYEWVTTSNTEAQNA